MYLAFPHCRRPLLLAACSALSVLSLSAQGMAEEPHPDNPSAWCLRFAHQCLHPVTLPQSFVDRAMKATCPRCNTPIPAELMNVATDVAACPDCGEVVALSSLIATHDVSPEFDINDPPAGAWFHDEIRGWRIGASTRSPMAVFIVPFMCVWSGIALWGVYGTQIAKGEFHLGTSLFGIPFVLGTLFLGGLAAMTVCGRVEVIVENTAGRIFAGVGPIGWTRRFDWSHVTQIEEDVPGYDYTGGNGRVISLVGKGRLKFGSMLSDSRRYFVLQGLRVLRQRT